MPDRHPLRRAWIALALAPAATAQYAEQQKLTSADGANFDQFATVLSIAGDTLVAGAPQDDSASGTDTGAAYVFGASGSAWTQRQKLVASDAAFDDQFGNAVAVWDGTIAVGARFLDDNGTQSGAVYVFERAHGTWIERQKLVAFDGAPFDAFGASVVLRGDWLFAGAPLDANPVFEAGSVYAFERVGTSWTFRQKLVAADAGQSDGFGAGLSSDGETLVAGSRLSDAGGSNAGAAYVFVRSGSTWTQQQKLTAFDPASGDQFGISVAVSGGSIAIGSFRDDDAGSNSGSVYVYARDGGAWTFRQKLLGSAAATNAEMGVAVAMDGGQLVVGAHEGIVGPVQRGTAYVFELRDGTWTEAQQLVSGDPPFDGGAFGRAVAASGQRVVVGDHEDSASGQQSGAAHVFADAEPGLASCFGGACPCANVDPAAGCANSTGAGARLGGTGSPSVAADDLVLQATGLPPQRVALFVASGATGSATYLDGLQCVAAPLFRYGASRQSSGAAGVATLVTPASSSAGFVAAGSTRHFQVVYRDTPASPCGLGGNWSSLYSVTFTP